MKLLNTTAKRVLLIIGIVVMLIPVSIKLKVESDAAEAKALEYVARVKNEKLKPTRDNYRNMRTSPLHHVTFRRKIDIRDGWKKDSIDDDFKDRIRSQVEADVEGLKMLTDFLVTVKLKKDDPTRLKQIWYDNYGYNVKLMKSLSGEASSEVAKLLSNPFEAAVAYHNNNTYHGIAVKDYIFSEPGISAGEGVLKTHTYLNKYKEYWVDYMLIDNYYDIPKRDRPKFKYISQ